MSLDKENSVLDIIDNFSVDENGYVEFGLVARDLLNQQSQYASRYVDDLDVDYPNFGERLRFIGNSSDYHSMLIYKEDIITFVSRVLAFRKTHTFGLSEKSLKILEECQKIVGGLI